MIMGCKDKRRVTQCNKSKAKKCGFNRIVKDSHGRIPLEFEDVAKALRLGGDVDMVAHYPHATKSTARNYRKAYNIPSICIRLRRLQQAHIYVMGIKFSVKTFFPSFSASLKSSF
uniref:Uncharacterized protein n=1 Tax=Glossina pallidipes TaxID=7398 RepID=A0A1A9Z434_GLOPL